jgi:hypothetical protein
VLSRHQFPKALLLTAFVIVFVACFGWAAVTGHVWEDFWITFRSSKNLVAGNGLVFNQGERLHTFTSPLGVLLPAGASSLAGPENDVAAIWMFRAVSSAAFAAAIVMLMTLCCRRGFTALDVGLVICLAAADAKSIDFTINGMETGVLLGFIAYALWGMFAARERLWVHLGCAWAGLMWTRPDSFIYVGLFAVGRWLFASPAETGLSRLQWVGIFWRAASLCAVLYLPWFVWAWWYYGSPVPHTVTAKGILAEPKTVLGALQFLISLPQMALEGRTSLEGTFLASYYQIGGWPDGVVWVARIVATLVAVQWLLPWRSEVRVASFVFFGMHFYLSYYPFFPFPWYLPGTALLAAVVIGGGWDQSMKWVAGWHQRRRLRVVVLGVGFAVAIGLIASQAWLSWQMMRQMKVEQELSANAVRRAVGEWLRDNAAASDTVLMEPLGHIAYFSGLRTLDLPGLSSRESARALKIFREVGLGWAYVADYLSPDWLVLRPSEIDHIRHGAWQLLGSTYRQVMEFDTTAEVERLKIYGKGYVKHDARWVIFKRAVPKRHRINATDPAVQADYPLPIEEFDGRAMHKLHAAGVMSFMVPDHAGQLQLDYGLPAGTYVGEVATDGVRFQAYMLDGADQVTVLLDVQLDPAAKADDRGRKRLVAQLPPGRAREVVLVCSPGASDLMDWSCWSQPVFK